MQKVVYADLNARQKESYNFHKVAALLADYGYTSLWLNDDYRGADFIAVGVKDVLKVQLKSRFTVDKRYLEKEIFIAAPIRASWYVYPHDLTVSFLEVNQRYVDSQSWATGGYSSAAPASDVMEFLAPWRLDASSTTVPAAE